MAGTGIGGLLLYYNQKAGGVNHKRVERNLEKGRAQDAEKAVQEG